MRLIIKTTPNTVPIPFDYQSKMVGTLHKWIGKDNDLHDSLSLYSFSFLHNTERRGNALACPKGSYFFISFYDEFVAKSVCGSILEMPEMFCGITAADIVIEATPDLTERELFRLASPVFVKRKNPDGALKFYTYEDSEVSDLLKETIFTKMKNAGLPLDESLDIRFDTSYSGKKIKMVTYNGIKNKVSVCPVIISGQNYTKQFIWNVGLGNSTGIGLGAIC